ncbi:MAG TPA: DUF1648 domain-containing protein [Ktedonobacterales bacterium]|nr:DUF1648 domain-containing protein [Ktedonobacterales bacterium]
MDEPRMTQRRGWNDTIEQRPHIHPPRSLAEVVCTGLTVAALVALLTMTAYWWSSLPAIVPTHFGANGLPNGYGSKLSLLLLPCLLLALTLLFALLARFPWAFNYPVVITAQNAERQYRRGRTALAVVNAASALTFTIIQWQTIQVARGAATGLGPAFSQGAIIIFAVLVPIVVIALIAWWVTHSE